MFHTESKGLPIPGRLFCLSGVPKLVGVDALIDPFSSMDGLYWRVDEGIDPYGLLRRFLKYSLLPWGAE